MHGAGRANRTHRAWPVYLLFAKQKINLTWPNKLPSSSICIFLAVLAAT